MGTAPGGEPGLPLLRRSPMMTGIPLPNRPERVMDDLKKELEYREQLARITNIIHSAPDTDSMLAEAQDRICELLDAERITIYAGDPKTNQLRSVYQSGEGLKAIELPVNYRSIAGYVALTGAPANVPDAYDPQALGAVHPKLAFDPRWDEASGFKTKQVLSVPLKFEGRTYGVLQLVNATDPSGFSERDSAAAEEIAGTLAIALFNQRRARSASRTSSPWRVLVDRNRVSEKQLTEAAALARNEQHSVASVLMDHFHVPRQEIGQALSQFHGCTFFRWDGSQTVPDDLKAQVEYEALKRDGFAPVARAGLRVTVVVDDPQDLVKLDRIRSLGLAPELDVWVGITEDISSCIDQSFGLDVPDEDGEVAGVARQLAAEGDSDPEAGEDSAIVKLVNQVILRAWQLGASDIHLEPNGDERPVTIRMRVDGVCAKQLEVPAKARRALASRIKILAGLDIAERRKPQDGKIRFKTPKGVLELRVAVVPSAGGEDLVLRLLAASRPVPLEEMALSPRNLEAFREAIHAPYGMLLVVGPTGSGKTTTLHSALAVINTPERKIWTAEDPIEISQPGLRQVQVHPKIGFDFSAAMRAFLRADPDVIMVGEIRDSETAGTAVEASLTGHLVFSTLHTNTAPETVVRLIDLGVDPFNFADAMLGIMAQRLARTLCTSCRKAHEPDEKEFAELARLYGSEEFAALGLKPDDGNTIYTAAGCSDCGSKGYRGRVALHEYLAVSEPLRSAIQENAKAADLRDIGKAEGMTTLLQDGIQKVFGGRTDLNQVRAVCLR